MIIVFRSRGVDRRKAAAGVADVSVGAGLRSLPDLADAKSGRSWLRKVRVSRMLES
jgi:hypothetical protein